MNRTRTYALAAVLGLAGSLGLARSAAAQPLPPIIAAPPAVFVATASPVYYEGHAAYWYRDHWIWRDGRGWHWYDSEPAFLHDHRVHAPPHPARRYYERRRR